MKVAEKYVERAEALFKPGCTCGGIDIGVGQMHDPSCGMPTPDDVARELQAVAEETLERTAEIHDRLARESDEVAEEEVAGAWDKGEDRRDEARRFAGMWHEAAKVWRLAAKEVRALKATP